MPGKKITFIFGQTYPSSNGVGNCTLSFAAALTQKGYDVSIITCKLFKKDLTKEIYRGVTFYRILHYEILGSRLLGLIHTATTGHLKLFLHLKKHKPDILIGMMLDYGFLSAWFGKLFNIKTVTNAQGSDVDEVVSAFRKYITLYALKKNDIVTTTNQEFKEKLLKRVRRDIQIWPNIVDETLFPSLNTVTLSKEKFHLVTVGRLVRMHGIETKGASYIIKAMEGLIDCHLHVFGNGPLSAEYQLLIKKLGIEDRVTLHGHTPRHIVLEYMQSADALVFPSLTEGLSMTVIESMFIGLPVITTKVGGQADHIKDGINGFFVERASSKSIQEKIKSIKENPGILQQVSMNAKNYVHEMFSFHAFVTTFENTVFHNN